MHCTGKGKEKALASADSVDCAADAANMATKKFQRPKWIKAVEVPSEDLEEEVHQLVTKRRRRFAILADEDEELGLEALPGLEMRKTAALLVRKYSVCSVRRPRRSSKR